MSETIDPGGAVEGGSVQFSYLGADYPGELDVIIDVMLADLSDRLAVGPAAIKVLTVDLVAWSDASLGCPQPRMRYAQVVTDGMRVVLEAGGTLYDYRSGGNVDPFLCVKVPAREKMTAGLYELTEDGVVQIRPPSFDEKTPTEGKDPPDE